MVSDVDQVDVPSGRALFLSLSIPGASSPLAVTESRQQGSDRSTPTSVSKNERWTSDWPGQATNRSGSLNSYATTFPTARRAMGRREGQGPRTHHAQNSELPHGTSVHAERLVR